jgi:superoxide dismutase, Cu-Zn family
MDSTIYWRCAALIAVGALAAGCEPDNSQRNGAAQSRSADTTLSRNESGQTQASNREAAPRPPTTAANPAAPGSAAAPGGAPPSATPRLMARAEIRPLTDNTVRGIVEFQEAASADGGPMTIHVMLMGLSAGPHGLHVHEGTDCMAPGEHLNPQNAPHGPANAASGARHLGDLGNVTADASGMAEATIRDSLLGGDATFVGKVLMIHEDQDDLSTQPDGSSGRLIGCGVIEAAGEDVLSRADGSNLGV